MIEIHEDVEIPCTQKDDDVCKDVSTLGKCKACGYVFHDIPKYTDFAHEELCCGSESGCTDSAGICVTHEKSNGD